MKIAVYTIAKNEREFVQRWADSALDADWRIICDTGSGDGTPDRARELGLDVHERTFSPWRFDTARNWSIDCIPPEADLAVCMDMDEVLLPGWRDAIERALGGDLGDVTRLQYKYVWSWTPEGGEGLVYRSDKIHRPRDYSWRHPVHEVLEPRQGVREVFRWIPGLEIHHHPDSTKSRGGYLPLLELAVGEDPGNDRNTYYLGREYYYHGRNAHAGAMLKRYLEIGTWRPERASACRILSKVDPEGAERWLLRAVGEDPGRREGWIDLAAHYYSQSDWEGCRWASMRGRSITEKPLDYLCEEFAWGPLGWDYGAISAYHLGRYEEALALGREACLRAPGDSRLAKNLEFYSLRARGE